MQQDHGIAGRQVAVANAGARMLEETIGRVGEARSGSGTGRIGTGEAGTQQEHEMTQQTAHDQECAESGVRATPSYRSNLWRLDRATGRPLSTYQCDAGVNAPPVPYFVAGRHLIAVAVGGNALFGFKQGDIVMAFGLPE